MQVRNTFARSFVAALIIGTASSAFAADKVTQAPAQSPDAATYTNDALITSKVKAALLEDKDVSSLKINVTTNEGVVVLSGNTPSTQAAQHVVQVAAGVDGVKDIKSDLKLGN